MEIINTRDIIEDKKTYLSSPPSPPSTTTTSPPSSSPSPNHEFSFTISLHPHPPPPQPSPIDLSPADDIFFHGHLLPLRHLSHLPDSPRSSTNSIDSFTLPINLLFTDTTNPTGNTSFHCHHQTTFSDFNKLEQQPKSKSFSIFGIPKWKKKRCDDERESNEDQSRERKNKKLKLDNLGQLIKRYMKMVKPLLSFPKSSRRSNTKFNHQSYSFSDSKPPEMNAVTGGKRRGRFSAPASMRTSPANSGILSPIISTSSESTMEELHAAIQAAIAHCKNSVAIEDTIKSQN